MDPNTPNYHTHPIPPRIPILDVTTPNRAAALPPEVHVVSIPTDDGPADWLKVKRDAQALDAGAPSSPATLPTAPDA